MTLVRIYDYTDTLKDSYFISANGKVVMIDLDYGTIKVSGFRLRLYLILMKSKMKELEQEDQLYQKVLNTYSLMLKRLTNV